MTDPFKKFKKDVEKMPGVTTSSSPPRFWLNTGAYTVNKVISGSYNKGYASSRLTMVAGPSDAGKSFFAMNAAVEAQKKGYGVFILDSEHAIDDDYMKAVGIDLDAEFLFYHDVKSLETAKKLTTEFVSTVRNNKDDLPPFVMLIDSLDQLKTEAHVEKSEKGELSHDRGQQAKLQKQFASDLAHDVRDVDIFGIITKQPYANQDPIMSKVKPYIITEAVRYPFSQIILLQNRRVKDKKSRKVEGIEVKVFGEKTRFCKPFQECRVDIPYDTGIDPFSGILEAAESVGIIEKNGAWYTFEGDKFQESGASAYMMAIYDKLLDADEDGSTVLELNDEEDSDD